MLKVHETRPFTANRRVSRDSFGRVYWSANKVNFDEDAMPQTCRESYSGLVHLIEVAHEVHASVLKTALTQRKFALCEVVEAFIFGVVMPDLVRQYPPILALGTIGSPDGEDFFCPQLFLFGKNSVSLGIEYLVRDSALGEICVPRGTHFLALDA